MCGGIWVWRTVGRNESKTSATQLMPSGRSLRAGRVGKLKKNGETVEFVSPPPVEFLSSVPSFKLSTNKISSSFRVAPTSSGTRFTDGWALFSFLLITTFRLSRVFLSLWGRALCICRAPGVDLGSEEQREVVISSTTRACLQVCLRRGRVNHWLWVCPERLSVC